MTTGPALRRWSCPGFSVVATVTLLHIGSMVCAEEPAVPAAVDRPATLTVNGVVHGTDGKPAGQGATVWLVGQLRDQQLSKRLAETTAQAGGEFSFSTIPAGPEVLRAVLVVARDAQGRLGWSANAPLPPNAADSSPPMRLSIALQETADVHGQVVNAAGQPLMEARVTPKFLYADQPLGLDQKEVRRVAGALPLADEFIKEPSAVTDAEGRFVLRNLPRTGRITSDVRAVGYGSAYVVWNLPAAPTIRLQPAGTIRGKLDPVPDVATVRKVQLALQIDPVRRPVEDRSSPNGVTYFVAPERVVPNADGSFEFREIPPGRYLVVSYPDGDIPLASGKPVPVEVRAGVASELVVSLEPAQAIRGMVIDGVSGRGIGAVTGAVYSVDGPNRRTLLRTFTTDAAGNYTALVRPGLIRIQIRQTPPDYLVPGDEPQHKVGRDHKDPDTLKIGEQGAAIVPIVRLVRAVQVEGIAVDKQGAGISGAEVHVLATGLDGQPGQPSTVTDAEGRFQIARVDPGDSLSLRLRTATATSAGAIVLAPDELRTSRRYRLSEEFAFRLRGKVVSSAGGPLPGAEISVQWYRRSVRYLRSESRTVTVGTTRADQLEVHLTGADGAFLSAPLWAGDSYTVNIAATGFTGITLPQVVGESGATHDFGTITLARKSGVVAGRLIDSAGQAVAGARVFTSGDGSQSVSTQTGEDGRFQLQPLITNPATIFIEHERYRFTNRRVELGAVDLSIEVRRRDEPVAPRAPFDIVTLHAEQRRHGERLLRKMWTLPKSRSTVNCIRDMAYLNPEQAYAWVEETKDDADVKRHLALTGAKSLKEFVTYVIAHRKSTPPDEALALLPQLGAFGVFGVPADLAVRYRADPERALVFAERAAIASRTVIEPFRVAAMARAGALLLTLGKEEAGRKLIEDAGELASSSAVPVPINTTLALVKGVAHFDVPRALAMVEILNARDKARGRATIIGVACQQDLDRALALIETTRPEPADLYEESRLKLLVAALAAGQKPREALVLANSIPEGKFRAEALGWVAIGAAPGNKDLAYSAIDQALEIFATDPVAFRSWSSGGGVAHLAAHLAYQATQAGYPDRDNLVSRVLSARTDIGGPNAHLERLQTSIQTAMVLALSDPEAARQVLRDQTVPEGLLGRGGAMNINRHFWLMAWALSDPARAADLIDKELDKAAASPDSSELASGVAGAISLLCLPPDEQSDHVLSYCTSITRIDRD